MEICLLVVSETWACEQQRCRGTALTVGTDHPYAMFHPTFLLEAPARQSKPPKRHLSTFVSLGKGRDGFVHGVVCSYGAGGKGFAVGRGWEVCVISMIRVSFG